MRKKNWLLVIMILDAAHYFASNESLSVQQIRCQEKFFDRYQTQANILLRIRNDVISHQKKIATLNPVKLSEQTERNGLEEMSMLLQKCDVTHQRLFASFEKSMNDYQQDADVDFFRKIFAPDMVVQTTKNEDVFVRSLNYSSEQTPFLKSENVSGENCFCLELLMKMLWK